MHTGSNRQSNLLWPLCGVTGDDAGCGTSGAAYKIPVQGSIARARPAEDAEEGGAVLVPRTPLGEGVEWGGGAGGRGCSTVCPQILYLRILK